MEAVDFKVWTRQSKEALLQMQQVPAGNREEFGERLLEYIRRRFLLTEKPKLCDSVYDLAEQSVARIAGMSSEQLSAMEDMSGCTGAKSAMVKKVLLLMSLKEHLHWTGEEEELTEAETVEDILRLFVDIEK